MKKLPLNRLNYTLLFVFEQNFKYENYTVTFIFMQIAEYSKRLSRYCKLNIVEVADEKTIENSSDTEINLIKEKS